MSALNPALRVGRQLSEVAEVHEDMSKASAQERAVRPVCVRFGSGSPEARVRQYPHEFSGGMRQRAVIAMGLMARAEADHRRRAHDRPRRDGAAADPRAAARCQRLRRLCRDFHLARRRGRLAAVQPRAGDVRRTGRRGARRPHARRRAGASLHAALVASVPTMDSDRGRPLASIPGRAPGPFDDVARLPVRAALPACDGTLPQRASRR